MQAGVRAVLVVGAVLVWLGGLGASRPAAAAGPWSWPVAGPPLVTRPFTPPAHRYGAGHRGVDLLSAPGAAVRAAGPGRVAYAGLLAGRGVLVVVHGPLRTTYEPVAATVALGAAVTAGEVIGRVEAGHAGCAAAACLHWGLRRGEDYLDPLRLVDPGPVRLLPLGTGDAAVPTWPALRAGPVLERPAGLRPGGAAAPAAGPGARAAAARGDVPATSGPAPPGEGVPVLPGVLAAGAVAAGGVLARAAARRPE